LKLCDRLVIKENYYAFYHCTWPQLLENNGGKIIKVMGVAWRIVFIVHIVFGL
jgi:hypothetical protein